MKALALHMCCSLDWVACAMQWIPPHERAKAVSLSTSGMYLGSAAGMLVLPSIAARASPAALLKFVGALGYAWLAFWLTVGKEVPHRCETTSHSSMLCHSVTSLLRVRFAQVIHTFA